MATSARPYILSWKALCAPSVDLPEELAAPSAAAGRSSTSPPLLVRFASPTGEEAQSLATLGGATSPPGPADVEWAGQSVLGLHRAVARLEQQLAVAGRTPRYATPPAALVSLLDRAQRQAGLRGDSVPVAPAWTLARDGAEAAGSAGSHSSYEALRDRLRQNPGQRAVVKLAHSLGEPAAVPGVVAWLGGRGVRAQANCCFTPHGAARAGLHTIEDEAALRPLLGRLFELGATVEEEWPSAEIDGRPFVLSLLATAQRIVLADVGPGGAFRARGAPPERGVPRDPLAIRRQMAADLYERIEEACVRLSRLHRCAALGVDVALSRRFDRFVVLDVDPFAEMAAERRDATGWSGSDHLCRAVREL